MALKVRKNGNWVDSTSVKVKKGGVWQEAKTIWKKISGDWVKIYNSVPWTWYIKLDTSEDWLPLTNNSIILESYADSDNPASNYVDMKYVDNNGNDYVDVNEIEYPSYRTIIRDGDVFPALDSGSNEIPLDSNMYSVLPKSGTFYIAIYSDETEVIRSTNYATLTIS